MSEHILSFDTLAGHVGQPVGSSSWIEITQARIDAFAACTDDAQWIHVDVERARRESPLGTTIAHGFLTLALLSRATAEIYAALRTRQALNYGLDKLRFLSPVRAGSRLRAHARLLSVQPRDGGWLQIRTEFTMEIENEDKPALVAVAIALLQPA